MNTNTTNTTMNTAAVEGFFSEEGRYFNPTPEAEALRANYDPQGDDPFWAEMVRLQNHDLTRVEMEAWASPEVVAMGEMLSMPAWSARPSIEDALGDLGDNLPGVSLEQAEEAGFIEALIEAGFSCDGPRGQWGWKSFTSEEAMPILEAAMEAAIARIGQEAWDALAG